MAEKCLSFQYSQIDQNVGHFDQFTLVHDYWIGHFDQRVGQSDNGDSCEYDAPMVYPSPGHSESSTGNIEDEAECARTRMCAIVTCLFLEILV
jgi:hypothetical protein